MSALGDAYGRLLWGRRILRQDAIRRRGENVSSYEVEQVLLSHPNVAEAAAFPVRSELAEDEVMVAIVPRDGHALTPAMLAEHCQGRMSAFAIPRFIEFLTALPARFELA